MYERFISTPSSKREDVSLLEFRLDIVQLEKTLAKLVTDEMVASLYMLSPFVEFWILDETDRTLVVTREHYLQ